MVGTTMCPASGSWHRMARGQMQAHAKFESPLCDKSCSMMRRPGHFDVVGLPQTGRA